VTAIAHALFEATAPNAPNKEELAEAVRTAAIRETSLFMSIYEALSPQARVLLEALAAEPTKHPMAGGYMSRHKLTTAGTVRKSLASLVNGDHIASDENGLIRLTFPLMTRWLNTEIGQAQHVEGTGDSGAV